MGACAIDSRDPLVVEYCLLSACIGLPGGSAVEDPPAKSGDSSLVAGSGRSPAEGNGNSLQYSCLENPMDRGTCGLQSQIHTQLNNQTATSCIYRCWKQWAPRLCGWHWWAWLFGMLNPVSKWIFRLGLLKPKLKLTRAVGNEIKKMSQLGTILQLSAKDQKKKKKAMM